MIITSPKLTEKYHLNDMCKIMDCHTAMFYSESGLKFSYEADLNRLNFFPHSFVSTFYDLSTSENDGSTNLQAIQDKYSRLLGLLTSVDGLVAVAIEKNTERYPLIDFIFSGDFRNYEDTLYDVLYSYRLSPKSECFNEILLSEEEFARSVTRENFEVFKRRS